MHIPDGYLSDPICAATAMAATAGVTWSVLQLRSDDDRPRAGQMAVVGAGVFAMHLLNAPIDYGTSGHLVGAAAAAALLGPWAATLTMAVVLALECLLFGDGGLGSLGANVLNMAVLAPWAASAILTLGARRQNDASRQLIAVPLPLAAAAGLGSTLLAVVACGLELGLSGAAAMTTVLPAMFRAHMLVGIAEGCFTAGLLALIGRHAARENRAGVSAVADWLAGRSEWLAAMLALAAAVVLAPWACSLPDGLEHVAQTFGFADLQTTVTWSLAPDYLWPGIAWQPLATSLAALVGIAAVYLATYGVGRACTVRGEK